MGSLWPSAESSLQCVGSLVAACGVQLPDQGSKPGPLHWQHGVLTTGPPGKSQPFFVVVELYELFVYLGN